MLVEIGRSLLVFAHLMFFSGAIVMVIWADYSIIKDGADDFTLKVLANRVVVLFLLLWSSGLLLVFIDTGFDPTLILSNSKLMLKFACVMVLTLNGLSLHFIGLKLLSRKDKVSLKQARILFITGALSTSNWLLAGFIGSANFLVQIPLRFLLIDYLALILIACLCALLFAKPVQRQLNRSRAKAALSERGITPVL